MFPSFQLTLDIEDCCYFGGTRSGMFSQYSTIVNMAIFRKVLDLRGTTSDAKSLFAIFPNIAAIWHRLDR